MVPLRRLSLLAPVAVLALAACAPSPSLSDITVPTPPPAWATPSAVPPVAVASQGEPRQVGFDTQLTSTDKKLHSVGPSEQITYGWNNLEGVTTFEDKPAKVVMQGSVWYVSGSGPFNGFLTLTFDDGSTLGFQMSGTAAKDKETTTFHADLVVIGGSGRYANSSGGGTWRGFRDGALGLAVKFTGDVTLTS